MSSCQRSDRNRAAGGMALTRAERADRYLRIASTLCYVECVFLALSAIALGIPAIAQGAARSSIGIAVIAAEAIVFGIAGRRLRKHQRSGARVAIVVAGLATLVHAAFTRTLF